MHVGVKHLGRAIYTRASYTDASLKIGLYTIYI